MSRERLLLVCGCSLCLLISCTGQEAGGLPPTQTFIPYATTTPPARPRPQLRAGPSSTPAPTATPLTHVVGQNETLLGIASQYGVSLDALLAANPGVNPRFLSIGQGLIIPGPDGQPITSLYPTPMPLPVRLVSLDCYPTPSDSLWCLATVLNSTETVLEGLSAVVNLVGQDGQVVASAVANAPANLLPEGETLALAAFFAPPAPTFAAAQMVMRSAVALPEGDERYVGVEVVRAEDVPGLDDRSYGVSGRLAVSAGTEGARARLAVLALGLDVQGVVVGYTRWEEVAEIEEGKEMPFRVTVVSLGPAIDRVDLLAEGLLLP